jgi:probable rRNA maturation factor
MIVVTEKLMIWRFISGFLLVFMKWVLVMLSSPCESLIDVLSFGNGDIDEFGVRLLGDIVICAPVLSEESLNQGKEQAAHFAHLLVHGILHLLGYDHLQDAEAEEMESIEARILSTLGWSNPYIEKTDDD